MGFLRRTHFLMNFCLEIGLIPSLVDLRPVKIVLNTLSVFFRRTCPMS